jgi:dipeptidyl aminopeptidase/acylaminoacyl peptidase
MLRFASNDLARSWVGAIVCVFALAQGPPTLGQGTRADYDRADALRDLTRGKVFRDRVTPHWFAGNNRFWYRLDLAGGTREFVEVDAVGGKRLPAFDHAKLAASLARSLEKPVSADRLPIEFLEFDTENRVHFEAAGKGWKYDREADKLEPAEIPRRPDEPADPAPRRGGGPQRRRQGTPRTADSPDGKWTAFVKDHDLHIRKNQGDESYVLGQEGTEADGYEEGVFWSPDSKKLVAIRTAKGDTRKVYLIESSPKDQLQPKLSSYDYLKPGDRTPISKPHLFDVEGRKEIALDDKLFENPWSNEEYRWTPDSKRFTFLYNQRGHQALRLLAVDAESGEVRPLIDEKSLTFIDYNHKTYYQHFDRTDEILWMSERDGWNHLYLIDARTGAVKNSVTKGPWVVQAVERVDEDQRQVTLRVVGFVPGQDPYYVHVIRVNFDGSGLTALTEGDGTHVARYSPDRRFLIDSYSRVDLPPVTTLRKVADGSLVCELEKADASALLATGWKAPERFVSQGRDGVTEIHGIIIRPMTLDPARKYPIIEAIYAGPQGAFVPKAWSEYSRNQALAELGFVIVQIDGMGTNWRSKAFHDVCARNLADAGFPDRIPWIKAAAAKYPYMDVTRVGLYGGSAGGQNALGGLLFHPEFYKVAVADCGCHDNRMDKIWWNEAWMGWPMGPHYAEQSNVTNAHKLQGALLLTVGELDHNVDPASTMQVVNALIKANKDFDLIVFPGADHGAGSSPYGERRRRDFFVKNLLGINPPNRNAVTTAEGGN